MRFMMLMIPGGYEAIEIRQVQEVGDYSDEVKEVVERHPEVGRRLAEQEKRG